MPLIMSHTKVFFKTHTFIFGMRTLIFLLKTFPLSEDIIQGTILRIANLSERINSDYDRLEKERRAHLNE